MFRYRGNAWAPISKHCLGYDIRNRLSGIVSILEIVFPALFRYIDEDGKLKQRKKPIKSSQFSDCRTCPHNKDIEYCKKFCKKNENNDIEFNVSVRKEKNNIDKILKDLVGS